MDAPHRVPIALYNSSNATRMDITFSVLLNQREREAIGAAPSKPSRLKGVSDSARARKSVLVQNDG